MKTTRRSFLARSAVAGAGLAAAWPRRAAWAAESGSAKELRFAFFTDIHARSEWETPAALERAADAINAQDLELAICGGDLITEGFESTAGQVAPRWDVYFEHLHRRLKPAVRTALGNHDVVAANPADGSPPADDPRAIFREKLGLDRTWYSFDWQGWHFVVLDALDITRDELQYRGHVGPEQLAWLRADLERVDPREPVIVVTHIPLLTSFYQATAGATEPAPRNRVVVNNCEVLKLFEGRHVPLVLQGHLHVNELLRWRGTTFITGGAVSARWWRGAWHGTEEGFGVVHLRAGRVEWEYLDYGWEARRPAGA